MTRRRSVCLLFAVATMIGLTAFPAARAQQPANQPGTKWTEAQLREAIDLARAGRKLTPKSWPNGARVAVSLSFDVDTEAPHLRDGTTSPTALSAAEFGAQSGVPRILKMLDRYQIPATFFITGVDAMLHPDMLAAIQKNGRHEIGVHGWIHETPSRLPADEEERLLDQAIDYLTKVTGKRPVGYRAPSWAFSSATLDLIQKKGFLYDSSLQAMDEPYEIMSRGKPTGIVELAIDWTLTETPFLGANGRMPSPALLYQLYKDEFDGAYDERTMFVLTLHPYLSGHRAPMQHLDRFVAYMKSKPGVWFATGAEIARYVKEQSGMPAAQPSSQPQALVPTRVTPLSNGRDLSGWKADVPAKDTNPAAPDSFIVRNGLLVSLGEPRGHLLTDAMYRDYRLEVEYRFPGKGGNCGVLVHASRLRALSAMFPQSIEVQMAHQNAGDFWCIEENIEVPDMETRRPHKEGQKFGGSAGDARRVLNLTDTSEKPLGEWNTMVIEARGRTIKVWVNGDLVNDGFGSTADRGKIALQAEGTEVEFRRVEIGPLPAAGN